MEAIQGKQLQIEENNEKTTKRATRLGTGQAQST